MLPADLSQQLQSLVNAGQVDQLYAVLQEVVRRYPQEPDVQHLLGWVATQQRRYEDAIYHFREAVRLKPDAAGSLHNLGLLLLDQERLGEAIDAFKGAVAVQPTYVDALTNLSLALCRANLSEHALFFL